MAAVWRWSRGRSTPAPASARPRPNGWLGHRELCDYATAHSRQRQLFLTFENFDRDIEKKRLIGPTAEAVALADAIDRPNFGLTIDLSHLPLLDETAADALHTAAPHLIHAHFGNCVVDHPIFPLYGDFHPRFGHPQGRSDLPEVVDYLRQLDDIDYWSRARQRLGATPILIMELRPIPGEEEPPSHPGQWQANFYAGLAQVRA